MLKIELFFVAFDSWSNLMIDFENKQLCIYLSVKISKISLIGFKKTTVQRFQKQFRMLSYKTASSTYSTVMNVVSTE